MSFRPREWGTPSELTLVYLQRIVLPRMYLPRCAD